MKFLKLKNQKGYTLIWVVCLLLVVTLLSSLIISVSMMTIRSTDVQYNSKQAYFSAKSVAYTISRYIMNATSAADVENLMHHTGSFTNSDMGQCTVDVSYVGSAKIKIRVVSTFRSETRTVVAYLVKSFSSDPDDSSSGTVSTPGESNPPGSNPANNLVYVTGSAGSLTSKLDGNIYIDGDFEYSNGSGVTGIAFVTGNATITGGATATRGLATIGTATISGGAGIGGDVNAKQNITISGGGTITGGVYSEKNVSLTGCKVHGDVKAYGDVTITGGATVSGSVYAGGNINISGGADIIGNVRAKGNIIINSGDIDGSLYANGIINQTDGTIGGSLYALGDISITNDVTSGDIYTKGNLSTTFATIRGNVFSDGNCFSRSTFSKAATVGGTMEFGYNGKVSGLLSYYIGYKLPSSSDKLATYAKNSVKLSSYTPLNLTINSASEFSLNGTMNYQDYLPGTIPVISAPPQSEFPALYNPVSMTVNAANTTATISSSGKITSDTISRLNNLNWGWGGTLLIDASQSDISLLLDNTSFALPGGMKIQVLGTNNVYFYLKGNSSISATRSNFIGPQTVGGSTQIFFFGDGSQSFVAQNTSVYATIYIPQGSFSATGGANPAHVGTICVKYFSTDSSLYFKYNAPDLTGTPLEGGGSGSGSTSSVAVSSGSHSSSPQSSGTESSGPYSWAIESWSYR